MITVRKSANRGKSQTEWLDSAHTFSFANYYDPDFTEFSALRVINEDMIQPGTGFGMHAHQHMEIITYVIDGVLEHKDSLGNGSQILPGEIQRMSAGHGVRHSEFNPSSEKPLHLLQIWIRPASQNLQPSYEQKRIQKKENEFLLIGSENGGDEVVVIHQDVKVFVAYLTKNKTLHYSPESNRTLWIQLIKGQIHLNNEVLHKGDGAAVVSEQEILVFCDEDAELLVFDLK